MNYLKIIFSLSRCTVNDIQECYALLDLISNFQYEILSHGKQFFLLLSKKINQDGILFQLIVDLQKKHSFLEGYHMLKMMCEKIVMYHKIPIIHLVTARKYSEKESRECVKNISSSSILYRISRPSILYGYQLYCGNVRSISSLQRVIRDMQKKLNIE